MLGHTTDSVLQIRFQGIFHSQPVDQSIVDVARAHANLVVELVHHDGSTVRARMSNSALVRDDDNVALAVFQDVTEQLWLDGS